MTRLDTNNDGCISREDYEVMSEKLAEYSGMTKEQTESSYKEFMKIADALGFKPGVNIPIETAAQQASEVVFSTPVDKMKALLYDQHNMFFDVIDTNKDGHISLKEFEVYMRVMVPNTSESAIIHSFNTIDTDKNGEISREEFLAAAEDFLLGVEETEVSKVFFGELLN